jgi:L-amino acid N-acyltransferase
MNDILIRPAAAADLEAINAIYNHYVRHSTCTYQTEPETPADRRAWFDRHGPQHPVIVAEAAGQTVGWGSLSAYHARAAYCHTVENSVYVRPDAMRRGIGSALLESLITRAQELGHRTIIAVIDTEQTASIAFHTRHGFVEAGRLREVGFKFGRWLDVVYMQLLLE